MPHSHTELPAGGRDFINDYEGITGHESFRGDLGCMYFPRLDAATGHLLGLELVPMQTKRFRVERASETDAGWLCSTLARESGRFGASALVRSSRRIELQW